MGGAQPAETLPLLVPQVRNASERNFLVEQFVNNIVGMRKAAIPDKQHQHDETKSEL